MPITRGDPPRRSHRAIPGGTPQLAVTRLNSHVTGVLPGSSTTRYTLISVSGTRTSLSGWLARMGFADVPRAERELAALGITGQGIAGEGHPVLAALARAADPDLALAGLAQVAERDQGLIGALASDQAFRIRLTAALGVSKALADHLARHPADSALLRGQEAGRRPAAKMIREEFLRAVAADPADAEPRAGQLTDLAAPA